MIQKGLQKGAVFTEGGFYYKVEETLPDGNYISRRISREEAVALEGIVSETEQTSSELESEGEESETEQAEQEIGAKAEKSSEQSARKTPVRKSATGKTPRQKAR